MSTDPAFIAKLIVPQNREINRAACKKCGYAGHLTFQCRNFLRVSTFTYFGLLASLLQHKILLSISFPPLSNTHS